MSQKTHMLGCLYLRVLLCILTLSKKKCICYTLSLMILKCQRNIIHKTLMFTLFHCAFALSSSWSQIFFTKKCNLLPPLLHLSLLQHTCNIHLLQPLHMCMHTHICMHTMRTMKSEKYDKIWKISLENGSKWSSTRISLSANAFFTLHKWYARKKKV